MNFKKYLPHLAAIIIFAIITIVQFSPLFSGKSLEQSDISRAAAMSQEVKDFRKANPGEEPLWTNSMFGGMPAYQISTIYPGNWLGSLDKAFHGFLPHPSGYIFSWLLGYSGGLGAIAGVMIADYWLVRNKNLNLGDLYRSKGIYGGWNWRAVIATLLGCGLALSWWIISFINSIYPIFGMDLVHSENTIVIVSKHLFDYAWFIGFGVAAIVHLILMKVFPPKEEINHEATRS